MNLTEAEIKQRIWNPSIPAAEEEVLTHFSGHEGRSAADI